MKPTPGDPIYRLPLTLPTLTKSASKGANVKWSIEVTEENGCGIITTAWGREGGEMQTTRDVIKTGKNPGKVNATSAVGQAVLEANATWKRKLERGGYGQDDTGGESKGKRDLSPMLAETFDDYEGSLFPDFYYMQPKLDGHRQLAHITKDGVTIYSRKGVITKTAPHIEAVLKHLCPLAKSLIILDGEFFVPDADFEDLSGAIRGKAKTEERAKLQAEMCYNVFDLFVPDKPNMIFSERFLHLSKLVDVIAGIQNQPVRLVPTGLVPLANAWKEHARHVKDGHEGAMLRRDKPYEPGKRSADLLKLKKWIEKEFKVIDMQPGRGKLSEAAICRCRMDDGKEFSCLAPGSVALKEQYLREKKTWVGRMLTVKYFCLTRKGVPKMPQAKAFRLPHE